MSPVHVVTMSKIYSPEYYSSQKKLLLRKRSHYYGTLRVERESSFDFVNGEHTEKMRKFVARGSVKGREKCYKICERSLM